MIATIDNDWREYDFSYHLFSGDEVKIRTRKGMQLGVVEKMLQKNIRVVIDGQTWKVSPLMVTHYRKGSSSNLPAVKRSVVNCNPEGLAECKPGDVVLMYRGGPFDVVEIVSLTPHLRCKLIGRRDSGKIYRYKPDIFVQKLNSELFSS